MARTRSQPTAFTLDEKALKRLQDQNRGSFTSSGTNGDAVATGATGATGGTVVNQNVSSGSQGMDSDTGGVGGSSGAYIKKYDAKKDNRVFDPLNPNSWSDDDLEAFRQWQTGADNPNLWRTGTRDPETGVWRAAPAPTLSLSEGLMGDLEGASGWASDISNLIDMGGGPRWDMFGEELSKLGRVGSGLAKDVGTISGFETPGSFTSFGQEVERVGDVLGEFAPDITSAEDALENLGTALGLTQTQIDALKTGSFGAGGARQAGLDQVLAGIEDARSGIGAAEVDISGLQEALAGGPLGQLIAGGWEQGAQEEIGRVKQGFQETALRKLIEGDISGGVAALEALEKGFGDRTLGQFLGGEAPDAVSAEALTAPFDQTRLGQFLAGTIPDTAVSPGDLTRGFDATTLGKILSGETPEITPEVALNLGLDPAMVTALEGVPGLAERFGGVETAVEGFDSTADLPPGFYEAVSSLSGMPGAFQTQLDKLQALPPDFQRLLQEIPTDVTATALMPPGMGEAISALQALPLDALTSVPGLVEEAVGRIPTDVTATAQLPPGFSEAMTSLKALPDQFTTALGEIPTEFAVTADLPEGFADLQGLGEQLAGILGEGGTLAGLQHLFGPDGEYAPYDPTAMTKVVGDLTDLLGPTGTLAGLKTGLTDATDAFGRGTTAFQTGLEGLPEDVIKSLVSKGYITTDQAGDFDLSDIRGVISEALEGLDLDGAGTGTELTSQLAELQTSLQSMLDRDPTSVDELRKDPITSALLADLKERGVEEEADLKEQLQRLGVLRSGATAAELHDLTEGLMRAEGDLLSQAAERARADREFAQTGLLDVEDKSRLRDELEARELGYYNDQRTMAGRESDMGMIAAVMAALDEKLDLSKDKQQWDLAKSLIDMLDLPETQRKELKDKLDNLWTAKSK